MRATLPLALLGVALVFGAGVAWTLATGRRLYACEQLAALQVEALMRAEEEHRRRAAPGAVPYAPIETLETQGLVSGFQSYRLADGRAAHLRDGYVFLLTLLPSPTPDAEGSRLGQRYQLWAWPREHEHRGLALFYASNAGALIAGENGQAAGRNPVLPDRTPLHEMELDRERPRSGRWTVLHNLRPQE